jgi:hypothetical protein
MDNTAMIDLNAEYAEYVEISEKTKEPAIEEDGLIEDILCEFAYIFGRKYVLIDQLNGLYRLKLVKDIEGFKKGTLGGLVENDNNLSHDGNCWIREGAKVLDQAQIKGNAQIEGNAVVRQSAIVADDVTVSGSVLIAGNTFLGGNGVYDGDDILFNFCEVVQDENKD